MRARRNPIDFALFVAFFPHLVAGPIMRAQNLLEQVETAADVFGRRGAHRRRC